MRNVSSKAFCQWWCYAVKYLYYRGATGVQRFLDFENHLCFQFVRGKKEKGWSHGRVHFCILEFLYSGILYFFSCSLGQTTAKPLALCYRGATLFWLWNWALPNHLCFQFEIESKRVVTWKSAKFWIILDFLKLLRISRPDHYQFWLVIIECIVCGDVS